MVKQIEGFDWMDERRDGNGFVVGRLKPGVSMKTAEAAINVIAEQLGREYPKADAGISIVPLAARHGRHLPAWRDHRILRRAHGRRRHGAADRLRESCQPSARPRRRP